MSEIQIDGKTVSTATADGRLRIAELKTAAIRLKSYGASPSTIAEKLHVSEDVIEGLITAGLREIQAVDVEDIRAMQQVGLNDLKRAMAPHLANGRDIDEQSKAAGIMVQVWKHEADLHGLKAPTRIRVGMDQETFTTRAEEDLRAIGIDPKMDVPLEEYDGWANT